MSKDIKLTIIDLCICYGCATAIAFGTGVLAYSIGKMHGKAEAVNTMTNVLRENNMRFNG